MKLYKVLEAIILDGVTVEAGAEIELTPEQAAEFGDKVQLSEDEAVPGEPGVTSGGEAA